MGTGVDLGDQGGLRWKQRCGEGQSQCQETARQPGQVGL